MNKIIVAGLMLLVSASSLAQTPQPGNQPASAYPAYSNELMDPRQTVQQGVERLRAFIDGHTVTDTALLQSFVQKEISPYFDFAAMTRLVLGPLEYQLTPKQRYATRVLVRNQFLAALAKNLMNYRGGRVDYANISGNLTIGRVNVRLRIYRPGQYPMGLTLRIARSHNGWKIYDISANGISAVAHFRNYVQAIILRSGPQGLMQP